MNTRALLSSLPGVVAIAALLGIAHARTSPCSLGDFNADGSYDCSDVNALTSAIASGSTDLSFDMNGDGAITLADVTDGSGGWLAVAGSINVGGSYLRGDTNLDGVVDGLDFIQWNGNKFTTNSAWCSGDFNANGVVDGLDFIAWNTNKFQASGF